MRDLDVCLAPGIISLQPGPALSVLGSYSVNQQREVLSKSLSICLLPLKYINKTLKVVCGEGVMVLWVKPLRGMPLSHIRNPALLWIQLPANCIPQRQ